MMHVIKLTESKFKSCNAFDIYQHKILTNIYFYNEMRDEYDKEFFEKGLD